MKFRAKYTDESQQVLKAAEKANYNNLGHAAASLRRAAMAKIRRGKKKAKPGDPPHTRKGQLRRSIVYSVDRQRESAIIGPRHSVVGTAAAAHEFGGEFRGQRYPQRPFMGPTLEENASRLGRHWAGSV